MHWFLLHWFLLHWFLLHWFLLHWFLLHWFLLHWFLLHWFLLHWFLLQNAVKLGLTDVQSRNAVVEWWNPKHNPLTRQQLSTYRQCLPGCSLGERGFPCWEGRFVEGSGSASGCWWMVGVRPRRR